MDLLKHVQNDMLKDYGITSYDFGNKPKHTIIENEDSIIILFYHPELNEADIVTNILDTEFKIEPKNYINIHKCNVRLPYKIIPDEARINTENSFIIIEAPRQDWKGLKRNIFSKYEIQNALYVLENLDLKNDDEKVRKLMNSVLGYSGENSHIIDTILQIGEPALKYVIEATNKHNIIIRLNTSDILGKIQDKRVINPLINLINDPNKYVRRNAVDALSLIGDEKLVMQFIDLLDDPDEKVRWHAVIGLANFGDERAIEPLKESDIGNASAALTQLHIKLKNKKQQNTIEEIKLKQEEKYQALLNSIENVDFQLANELIFEYIQDLESNYEDIQDTAATYLIKIGRPFVVGPLIDSLNSPNEDVRAYSAIVLGEIKDPKSVEPLITALRSPNDCSVRPHPNDPEWDFQALAGLALGNIGGTRVLESLSYNIEHHKIMDVRLNSVKALGETGDANALEPLTKALNDPAKSVRAAAAETLSNIGHPNAIWHITAACDDHNPFVRISAAKSLGKLGDPNGCDKLSDLIRFDKEYTVQLEAIKSLHTIGDRNAYAELEYIVKHSLVDLEIKKAAADALLKFE